ncbi:MAG: type II CAAX prenyl endopeptidase Rce1 family protein [Oscillospiraceae bacterium]
MNNDKSLIIKRILIYIILSFGITWALFYVGDVKSIYLSDREITGKQNLFAILSMFGPALANFITRGLTREGMQKSLLKFNIEGNFIYYVISVVVMILMALFNGILFPLIYLRKVELNVSPIMFIGLNLSIISSAICSWIVYFGEEFGWRGYLYPKLEELFGTGKTIVIGGIIWGLWHTPELLQGHNFGKDLPLFPISNIILMCIDCIFIGAFLTYLTKKTNSIYPACIAHSLNNNFVNIMPNFFISEEDFNTLNISSFEIMMFMFVSTLIIGTVSWVLLSKDKNYLS